MSDAFSITIGYPKVYVDFHTIYIRQYQILKIDQFHYIRAKLRKYGFDDCHLITVLANPANATHLSSHGTLGDKPIIDNFFYQECVCTWQ